MYWILIKIKHLERNVIKKFGGKKASSSIIKLLYEAHDAVTRIEFEQIMTKIKDKDSSVYEYLINIHGWSLYEAIENNCVLWGMKTNNMIEATFSWLSESRNLTPYYFVISVLNKIFESNFNLIDDMVNKNYNKLISPYALELFEKNGFKANEGGGYYIVTRTGLMQGYVKHARNSSKLNFYGYSVDLPKKTCSCQQYQQLGIYKRLG